MYSTSFKVSLSTQKFCPADASKAISGKESPVPMLNAFRSPPIPRSVFIDKDDSGTKENEWYQHLVQGPLVQNGSSESRFSFWGDYHASVYPEWQASDNAPSRSAPSENAALQACTQVKDSFVASGIAWASTLKMFCSTALNSQLSASWNERLPMYHTVASVQHHAIKSAVHKAAAVAAHSVSSQRWVDPQPPYQWTDPAAPLLIFFARGSQHTIMKSKDAFNVPHIVLTEAPSTDDSDEVYESNLLPNCGYQFTGWLCVPNAPVFAFDLADCDFDAETGYIDLDDELDSSDEETETSTETSEVGTPPLTSSVAMDSFTTVHAVHRKLAEIHGGDHLDLQPQSVCIFQVDDEDDLPEFDEWYSSIAQRAE